MIRNLALYTFGVLVPHASDEATRAFGARATAIYSAIANAEGYVAHAQKSPADMGKPLAVGQNFDKWGTFVIPRRMPGLEGVVVERVISTLSLWRDVDSAHRFVFTGEHRSALQSRRNWFVEGAWRSHVIWFVPEGFIPQWRDGVEKIEALAAIGDGPDHFSFRSPPGQSSDAV